MSSEIRVNVETFGECVKYYLRNSGYLGKELALEIALGPTELSRRLTGKARFTRLDVKGIIRALAHWNAITTEDEALHLLKLAGADRTIFSDDEWRLPPLGNLARHVRIPSLGTPAGHVTKHAQSTQRLCVFLCHSSGDKPQVRDIYKRLTAVGIEAWIDEESLLAGQDWELEISRAIRSTHVVIVCLSQNSTNKRGYVQKEIKFALDEADKQPEGTIFIIPVMVEECDLPDRLRRYHTLNLFEERGFEKLMHALRSRADQLGFTLTSI